MFTGIIQQSHFKYPGKWRHVMQFAYQGKLYILYTPFSVHEANAQNQSPMPSLPDRSRVQGEGLNEVFLETSSEVIKKDTPLILTFTFHNIDNADDIRPGLSNVNLVFALGGGQLFWNEHGDDSVKQVSNQSAFDVSQQDPTRKSVSYKATFPKAGAWLVRLEYRGEHNFFLDVDD